MSTLFETVFSFEASPLVASPHVVLSSTSASPDVAVCLLLLSIFTSFLLVTVNVLVLLLVTVLFESGPVLSIEPSWSGGLQVMLATDPLLTLTSLLAELELLASPLVAEEHTSELQSHSNL